MRTLFEVIAFLLVAALMLQIDAHGQQQEKGKVSQAETEKLIKQLGSSNPKTREEASKALIKIGADSLPALKAALKTDDVELRRRAEMLIDQINENVTNERIKKATRFGIDVLVERMVQRRDKLTEDDWDLLLKITTKIGQEAQAKENNLRGNFSKIDEYLKFPVQVAPNLKENYGYRSLRLASQGIVSTKLGISGCLVVNEGKIVSNGSTGSLIFTNGDINGGNLSGCVVICDGSIDARLALSSILVARGGIRVRGTASKDNVIEDEYHAGLPTLRFFSLRDLGIQLAGGGKESFNRVEVIKIFPDSFFEKAGLHPRRQILISVNGEKFTEDADTRKIFRRALASGRMVIEIFGEKKPFTIDIPW